MKLSQSFAQRVVDGIERLECFVGEVLFPQFFPQMLDRIEFRKVFLKAY